MAKSKVLREPVTAPPPREIPPPLVFEVRGRPVPKGSATAFVAPGKNGGKARAIVTQGRGPQRAALASYAADVREAAHRTLTGGRDVELEVARFVGVPVEVDLEFRLARPKKDFFTGKRANVVRDDAPVAPLGRPDVDKLARAALDALTGIAFHDDSQVARLLATKVWAGAAGEGTRIRIAALGATHLRVITTAPPPPVEGVIDVGDKASWKVAEEAAAAINARNAKLRKAAGPKFATDRLMLADPPAQVDLPLASDPGLDENDFG